MSNSEVEIKFKVGRRASKKLASQLFEKAAPRETESWYFDTADYGLRNRGIELRLRNGDGGYTQTIKAAAERPRAFERKEVECKLSGFAPDTQLLSALLGKSECEQIGTLSPRFETLFERRKIVIEAAGAEIEACLDIGEIKADDKSEKIREIELELKAGEISDLYDSALALSSQYDLTLLFDGKADRGYRLCTDAPIPAWKPKKAGLEPQLSLVDAMTESLRQGYTHFARNITPVAARGEPDAIHQMRVGIRRLMSIALIFSPLTSLNANSSPIVGLRPLFKRLGKIREMDVLLKDVLPETTDMLSKAQKGAIGKAIDRSRQKRHEALQEHIASSAFTADVLSLGQWIESGTWINDPMPEQYLGEQKELKHFAEIRLSELYDDLLSKRRDMDEGNPSQWHNLRIQTKRLRYASEFFSKSVNASRARTFTRKLSEWQDRLGRLNDIATASELITHLSKAEKRKANRSLREAALMVEGWAHGILSKEEPELVKHWRAFEKAKPFWVG